MVGVLGVVNFTVEAIAGVAIVFRVGVIVFPVGVVVVFDSTVGDIFCFEIMTIAFSGVSSRNVTLERRRVDALGEVADSPVEVADAGPATGDAAAASEEFRR